MSKAHVREALDRHLLAWVNKRWPVAIDNASFTVPAPDILWMRVTLIPAETVGASWCASELKGIYQIDIFSPKAQGPVPADKLADELAELFKAGQVIDGVKIPRPPSVLAGATGGITNYAAEPTGHYHTPVQVRYLY